MTKECPQKRKMLADQRKCGPKARKMRKKSRPSLDGGSLAGANADTGTATDTGAGTGTENWCFGYPVPLVHYQQTHAANNVALNNQIHSAPTAQQQQQLNGVHGVDVDSVVATAQEASVGGVAEVRPRMSIVSSLQQQQRRLMLLPLLLLLPV
jgi:hypothetical protein